jgi:predicted acyltransferase
MNDTLQRVAIALTLGLALVAMGHTIDSWQFWSILALLWASNYLHYQDGFETGVVHGMEIIADMTEEQRVDLIKTVKAVQAENEQ